MEKYSDFRPVIMGAATGYSPDKVELFLNSISQTNYTGVVALFLNESQVAEYKDFFWKERIISLAWSLWALR